MARYEWAAEGARGGRVLDAACGRGWGTARLAAAGASAIGVDLSPAAIADARRAHGEVAEFVVGDLQALPFETGEFELVACFEAIAHVAEPEPVLDELRRVLAAGGTLMVSAPNPGAYPAGNPLHLSEIGKAELERSLSGRFANVAVHGQRECFASLLGGAEGQPRVLGDAPGEELHTVAAASDGRLPPAPAWLALGEEAGYREQRELLQGWRERAVRAEAEALALRKELDALQS